MKVKLAGRVLRQPRGNRRTDVLCNDVGYLPIGFIIVPVSAAEMQMDRGGWRCGTREDGGTPRDVGSTVPSFTP